MLTCAVDGDVDADWAATSALGHAACRSDTTVKDAGSRYAAEENNISYKSTEPYKRVSASENG